MDTFIADATVFIGNGQVPARGGVSIRDGRIESVGPLAKRPPGATIVDGTGLFLMAGFIDAHTHLTWPRQRIPELTTLQPDTPFTAARSARTKLASGVTTVRDLGGNNGVDLELSRAIERGDVPGPRMIPAGRFICPTGGHVYYYARQADGPDEVRKAVREQIRGGAGLIKLMLSGGAADAGEDPTAMHFGEDEIRAGVRAASALHRRVAAHAHPAEAIRAAAAAGVVSVEHATYMDEETMQILVKSGTWVVPTQAVYKRLADNVDGWPAAKAAISRDLLVEKTPRLRAAVEAGVKIGVGTDASIHHFPHDQFASELLALTEVGLSNEQILTAATRGNAELLGLADDIGTVEAGKRADLVLLGGDPLDDLAHSRDVRFIVRNGRVTTPQLLADWNAPS